MVANLPLILAVVFVPRLLAELVAARQHHPETGLVLPGHDRFAV
jgi:hypothetical protein